MAREKHARCLHCGVRLPLYRKLTDGEFCSDEHRSLFQEEQARLAIERLQETHRVCQMLEATTAPAAVAEPASPVPVEPAPVASEPRSFEPQEVLEALSMASAVYNLEQIAVEPSLGMIALDPLAYEFPAEPRFPKLEHRRALHEISRAPRVSVWQLVKPALLPRKNVITPIQSRWNARQSLHQPATGLEPEFENNFTIADLAGLVPSPRITAVDASATPAPAVPLSVATRTWLPEPHCAPADSPFEPPMAEVEPLGPPLASVPGDRRRSAPDPLSRPAIQGTVSYPAPVRVSAPEVTGRAENVLALRPPQPAGADPVFVPSDPEPPVAVEASHLVPRETGLRQLAAAIRAFGLLNPLEPGEASEPPFAGPLRQLEAVGFRKTDPCRPAGSGVTPGAATLDSLVTPLPLEPADAVEPPHTWGLRRNEHCNFPPDLRAPALLDPPKPRPQPLALAPKVPIGLALGADSAPPPHLERRAMEGPESYKGSVSILDTNLAPVHTSRAQRLGKARLMSRTGVPVAVAPLTAQGRMNEFFRSRLFQMIVMFGPVSLVLLFWPAGKPAEPAAPDTPIGFVNARLADIKLAIQNRAGVEMLDDFRMGLDNWQGSSSLARSWSFDQTGFVKPGPLALYRPSIGMSDYSFEFLGQIDRRAIGWVYRAQDMHNYHVAKLVLLRPGPMPLLGLTRYSVINGRETRRIDSVLPINVHADTVYRVRLETRGTDFSLYVQNQLVQFWSDRRLPVGGVGFFSGGGEQSRIRWMQISHQYDAIGKLCAYFAPMAVVTYNMQPTIGAETK